MEKRLVLTGLSHRTASLDVREKAAVSPEALSETLEELGADGGLSEAVLISTCNRVELVAVSDAPHRVADRFQHMLNQRIAPERIDSVLYRHVGRDAASHLFRVAAGLDSMVLGEPQILGQIKDAFGAAQEAGTVGTVLGRCFERGFKVAKRVRTETGVAAGNVSVSSIACELAESIFGDLKGRRVLLVGAGKMSEVAARSLTARGASLSVVNRKPERAQALADACKGVARPLESLATELADADVVISSTAKDGFMITHELMSGVCKMRRYRPLFLIDIAVPRDVDPRVDSLRNVFLYDMDDLDKVSRENLGERERAVGAAEQIIDAELRHLQKWMSTQKLTPTIVALRGHVRETLLRELHKTMPKIGELDDAQKRALSAMCETMTNQLLHGPLTELKAADDVQMVEAVRRLFALEQTAEDDSDNAGNDRAPEAGTELAGATTPKRS